MERVMAELEKPPDLDRVVGWPPEGHKIESVAHVHAIGMIALSSAMMEEALTLLLSHLLGLSRQIAIPLVHKLTIRERSDLLRQLVNDEKTRHQDLTDHLIYAIECFEICNENRNILVHAIYERLDGLTATMTVTKRSKNNPLNEFRMELSLPTLRRAAEEVGNTVNFMLDLWFVLTHRPSNTLIRRPAAPHRLTPSQPPATPPSAPPRRRS
jgi:hypothetical protein